MVLWYFSDCPSHTALGPSSHASFIDSIFQFWTGTSMKSEINRLICFLVPDVPKTVIKVGEGRLENNAKLPNHGHSIYFLLILVLTAFVINNLTAVFPFSTSCLEVVAVT